MVWVHRFNAVHKDYHSCIYLSICVLIGFLNVTCIHVQLHISYSPGQIQSAGFLSNKDAWIHFKNLPCGILTFHYYWYHPIIWDRLLIGYYLMSACCMSSTDNEVFKAGFLFGPGCTPTCITCTMDPEKLKSKSDFFSKITL